MDFFSFWDDERFEFSAKMPEELLVKAMHSTRPIFLTDLFMQRIAAYSPEEVVKELVADLHREADPDESSDELRWHYLFMDFERDFPRLMMMLQQKAEAESGGDTGAAS